MSKLSESEIETLAIERLQTLGFDYVYAPDIAPDSSNPERESFAEVLLLSRLRNAVARINPLLPPAALDEAIKTIQRISSPELIANNEAFHRLLTEGIKVSYQKDGITRGDLVWLVDFDNPRFSIREFQGVKLGVKTMGKSKEFDLSQTPSNH